jgi:hypothetical protein
LLSPIARESHGFEGARLSFQLANLKVKNFNTRQKPNYPFEGFILLKKAGVKKTPSTKVELSYNKIARIHDLDELAQLLFPGNRNHQKIFLAIFIDLKYAPEQFLPSLVPLCNKYGISPRMMETVRSKLRRMGIIDHVSRFNKTYGYREGWVFSNRFNRSLSRLAELTQGFRLRKGELQERKDRDLFMYL